MRLRQIEAFRATMNAGSITGAAHTLSVSQPSVSRLIADLEADVDFRLFDRKSGRLQPTEEALRFYQEVEKTFAGLDHLRNVAERIRQEQVGLLNVFASPALATSLLSGVIKKFHIAYPNTKVRLDVRVPMEIFQKLQCGAGDVAVCNHAAALSGVVQEPLIDVAFVCALPDGHRLCEQKEIAPEDLKGETIIGLAEEGPLEWSRIFKLFETHNVDFDNWISTQHSGAAYAMVSEGMGIGILEPFSAYRWLHGGVTVRPLRPKATFSYSLCFSANKVRSSVVQDFASMVRQQLIDVPPVHQD